MFANDSNELALQLTSLGHLSRTVNNPWKIQLSVSMLLGTENIIYYLMA